MNAYEWWAAASAGKKAMTMIGTASAFLVSVSMGTGAWADLGFPIPATRSYVIQQVGMVETQLRGLRVDLLSDRVGATRDELSLLRRKKANAQKEFQSATTDLERRLLGEELERIARDLEGKAQTEIELKAKINRIITAE